MLLGLGLATDINLPAIAAASRALEPALGHRLPVEISRGYGGTTRPRTRVVAPPNPRRATSTPDLARQRRTSVLFTPHLPRPSLRPCPHAPFTPSPRAFHSVSPRPSLRISHAPALPFTPAPFTPNLAVGELPARPFVYYVATHICPCPIPPSSSSRPSLRATGSGSTSWMPRACRPGRSTRSCGASKRRDSSVVLGRRRAGTQGQPAAAPQLPADPRRPRAPAGGRSAISRRGAAVREAGAREVRRVARWLVILGLGDCAACLRVPAGGRSGSGRSTAGRSGGTAHRRRAMRCLGAPLDAVAARAVVRTRAASARSRPAARSRSRADRPRSLFHSPRHVLAVIGSLGDRPDRLDFRVFSALNGTPLRRDSRRQRAAGRSARYLRQPRRSLRRRRLRPRRYGARPARSRCADFEVLAADDGPAFEGVAAEGDRRVPVALGPTAAGTTAHPRLGGLLSRARYAAVHGPVARDRVGSSSRGAHGRGDRLSSLARSLRRAADIVGRSLLGRRARDVTIVGVAPPRFTGVQPSDVGTSPVDYVQLWLPLRLASSGQAARRAISPWLTVVGRLGPCRLTAPDGGAVDVVAASHRGALRPDTRKQAAFLVKPHGFGSGRQPARGAADRRPLFLAMPLGVLAIACANVASLQFARVDGAGAASWRCASRSVRRADSCCVYSRSRASCCRCWPPGGLARLGRCRRRPPATYFPAHARARPACRDSSRSTLAAGVVTLSGPGAGVARAPAIDGGRIEADGARWRRSPTTACATRSS